MAGDSLKIYCTLIWYIHNNGKAWAVVNNFFLCFVLRICSNNRKWMPGLYFWCRVTSNSGSGRSQMAFPSAILSGILRHHRQCIIHFILFFRAMWICNEQIFHKFIDRPRDGSCRGLKKKLKKKSAFKKLSFSPNFTVKKSQKPVYLKYNVNLNIRASFHFLTKQISLTI